MIQANINSGQQINNLSAKMISGYQVSKPTNKDSGYHKYYHTTTNSGLQGLVPANHPRLN